MALDQKTILDHLKKITPEGDSFTFDSAGKVLTSAAYNDVTSIIDELGRLKIKGEAIPDGEYFTVTIDTTQEDFEKHLEDAIAKWKVKDIGCRAKEVIGELEEQMEELPYDGMTAPLLANVVARIHKLAKEHGIEGHEFDLLIERASQTPGVGGRGLGGTKEDTGE